MAQVGSEQAVLLKLEELVKKHLGGNFKSLDTVKAKQSILEEFCNKVRPVTEDGQEGADLPEIRKCLADICSRMSLAILNRIYPMVYEDVGENVGNVLAFEAEDVIVRMKILRNSPGDRKQLAWAKLALDICSMIVVPDEEVKKSEATAHYCQAMAMFSLGHLESAKTNLESVKTQFEEGMAERYEAVKYRYDTKEVEFAIDEIKKLLEDLLNVRIFPVRTDKDKAPIKYKIFSKKDLENYQKELKKDGKEIDYPQSPQKILSQGKTETPICKKCEKKIKNETDLFYETRKIVMTIFTAPPEYKGNVMPEDNILPKGNILLESLVGLLGSAKEITVVSWNAQLMNQMDGPTSKEIESAIKTKAQSIAKAVEKPKQHNPGGVDLGAHLLLIQEAPGPGLEEHGSEKKKEVAVDKLFTEALKKHFNVHWDFREVSLHNKQMRRLKTTDEKKTLVECGEDHIYGWDSRYLEPIGRGPKKLDAPDGEWANRPPSWAEFRVLKFDKKTDKTEETEQEQEMIDQVTKETRLIVIGVHAKSGGSGGTENDIRMIGRAVDKLWASREAAATNSDLIFLVVGDFNYAGSKTFEERLLPNHYILAEVDEHHQSSGQDLKTNIWLFNKDGKESDGHAYDFGCVRSTVPSIKAAVNIPPIALNTLNSVQDKMQSMAKELKSALETSKDSLLQEENDPEGKDANTIAKNAWESIMSCTDQEPVPKWMRKIFQHQVKIVWSDHMPITITIKVPEEARSNSQRSSKDPLQLRLFNESEGAKGGE